MPLRPEIVEANKNRPQKIIFAEAHDMAILKAARYLKDKGLAHPILLGGNYSLRDVAAKNGIRTKGLEILNPRHAKNMDVLAQKLISDFGFERVKAQAEAADAINQALLRVRYGMADMAFMANLQPMSYIATQILKYIPTAQWGGRFTSFYILEAPNESRTYAFADCSININPKAAQLAEIALSTAKEFNILSTVEPKVAFLSFSTKGSAQAESVEKVQQAAQLFKEKNSTFLCDGELQFDAAMDAAVAQKKAPEGCLRGNGNLFIFPTLDAANIGHKIAEQVAGYTSSGPFFSGLAHAIHGLAKTDDTENIIRTVLMAGYLKIKKQ